MGYFLNLFNPCGRPKHLWLILATSAALCLGASKSASAAELTVVQVAPLKGEMAHYTNEIRMGMQAHLDHVNARGGVNGDTFRLVSLDDSANPQEALKKIESAAATLNPLAFMYLIGPETVAAANDANIFGRIGIPLLGTSPAAAQLRTPLLARLKSMSTGQRLSLRTMTLAGLMSR